jgi:hypothetical protein
VEGLPSDTNEKEVAPNESSVVCFLNRLIFVQLGAPIFKHANGAGGGFLQQVWGAADRRRHGQAARQALQVPALVSSARLQRSNV